MGRARGIVTSPRDLESSDESKISTRTDGFALSFSKTALGIWKWNVWFQAGLLPPWMAGAVTCVKLVPATDITAVGDIFPNSFVFFRSLAPDKVTSTKVSPELLLFEVILLVEFVAFCGFEFNGDCSVEYK